MALDADAARALDPIAENEVALDRRGIAAAGGDAAARRPDGVVEDDVEVRLDGDDLRSLAVGPLKIARSLLTGLHLPRRVTACTPLNLSLSTKYTHGASCEGLISHSHS